MTEWQVRFEFAHALSTERIEDLLIGPLAPYHACGSGDDGYDTSGVIMTVEAETAAGALDVAWRVVTAAESITSEELREFEVRPMPGEDEIPL